MFNIELENGIRIENVKINGVAFTSTKERPVFNILNDIVQVLKTRKDLGKMNITIDAINSNIKSECKENIFIYDVPLESILYLKDCEDNIVYNKYLDNIF